ncbi:MAG: pilus assembly protein [Alphaproteobacteria bacterium]|nr:MAG: pilus assembly protein [Alphaproteobacteria bacterium]
MQMSVSRPIALAPMQRTARFPAPPPPHVPKGRKTSIDASRRPLGAIFSSRAGISKPKLTSVKTDRKRDVMNESLRKFIGLFDKLRRDKRGIAAVEFAILSPIIIVMIVGVLETGRLLYTRSSLQSGLEMAGRYAMVHPNASQTELQAIAFGSLKIYDSAGSEPTLTMSTQGGSDADFLVLAATIDHQMLIPLVDLNGITLKAQTVVPIED